MAALHYQTSLVPHHQRDLPSRLSHNHNSLHEQVNQRMNRPLIIQRAPQNFRRGIGKDYLDPDVVSIGPYHRGAQHLAEMEAVKEAVAHDFITYAMPTMSTVAAARQVVAAVRQVVPEAKLCYAADGMEMLSDNEFTNMMVVDGCFLLTVAAILTREYPREHAWWTHGRMLRIMKDIMLFENQIPWVVVDALRTLRPVDMDKFVTKILAYFDVAAQPTFPGGDADVPANGHVQHGRPVVHLLDLIHQRHLGMQPQSESSSDRPAAGHYCDYARPFAPFTSAVELAEAGIKIHGNSTCRVQDVRVEPASRYRPLRLGRLALPPLVLSWLPRCWLINMVALECVTDRFNDSGVSSYLAILSSLINTEKDVQELREKRILFSTMSDSLTVDFFQGLLDPLPRQRLYLRTLKDIVALRASRRRKSEFHGFIYRNKKILAYVLPLLSIILAIVAMVLTNTIRHK